MYELNDSTVINSNKEVPNVMSENLTPNLNQMTIQEGANFNTTNPIFIETAKQGTQPEGIPTYAVDNNVQQFEIPDPVVRRAFARKVFTILLIQDILMLPIVEIFIVCFDPFSHTTIEGIRGVNFCFFIALYFLSNMRRYPPMNLVALGILTPLLAIEAGACATFLHSQLAIFPHLIVIAQLLALLGYSEQTRYKFNVFNAILLISFVSLIGHYLMEIIYPSLSFTEVIFVLISAPTYRAPYIVYDMHLMLSGHHGYNLQPNEYIFASTNIYADIPHFWWRVFKFLFITPAVKVYKVLVRCCFAEVC